VYGDATWISRAGERLRPKLEIPFNRFIWMHYGQYIPQPSAFWRRSLYERVGGLDPSFQLAMDADLFTRFADVKPPQHVRRRWSRMREYPEQKNQRFRARSDKELAQIQSRYTNVGTPTWRARKVAARGLRIGWKLLTGCYTRR